MSKYDKNNMKALIATILLFHHLSYSSDCISYNEVESKQITKLTEFADQLQQKINWFSATDKDVNNAKCKDNEDFSNEAIAKHLNSFGDEKVTRSINGLQITDHPRKIDLLRKFLKTGSYEPKVKLPEDSKNCKNVECVTKSLFSDQSNNYLYLLDKYGLNLNSERSFHTAQWNDQEIKNIMESINNIPKQLLPFETNQTFVRGKRNTAIPDSPYANAIIYFYDLHFTQTPQMQTYTIYHEVGHNIASEMALDKSEKWKKISDWQPSYEKDKDGNVLKDDLGDSKIKNWHTGHNHKMSSEYAKTNPGEDFAETFSAYRFSPQKLKEISPEKYEYMKNNVYQGIEFISEEGCKKENSFPHKLYSASKAKLPKQIVDLSVCQDSLTSILQKEFWKKELVLCAKKLKAQESIKQNISQLGFNTTKESQSSILNSPILPIEEIQISEEELKETKIMLTEEIMNSFIKNFKRYASCDEMKDTLSQNLDDIEKKVSDFQYFYSKKETLNESLYKICKEHSSIKNFSCLDELWRLNNLESKSKENLCKDNKRMQVICDGKISRYKTTKDKADFTRLCKSPNLKASYEMNCDRKTRKIFAGLANLEVNISDNPSTNGKCNF